MRRQPEHVDLGKLPPHSVEVEQGVLGCVLLDPSANLAVCGEALKDGESAFYDRRHQTLYGALQMMDQQGKPIDLITLTQWLRDHDELEAVGGLEYVATLPDLVPSSSNLDYYLGQLRAKAQLRLVIQTASWAMQAAFEQGGDSAAVVDHYVDRVMSLTDTGGDTHIPDSADLVRAAIDHIELAYKHRNQGLMLGETTGFSYLDKKIGGLERSAMMIVGGRPSTGKTSWACSLLLNLLTRGVRVGFISIEMSRGIITVRLLCTDARANLMEVNSGFASQADLTRIVASAGKLGKQPWDIVDTPGITPAQLRSIGRRLVARGCKVILIDHLHEVVVPEATSNGANMEQVQAAEAARAARWIARTCKVPVVALAQLSRAFETEAAKSRHRIPRMTDLRGSGFMEQMADVIGILYKDEERVDDEPEGDGRRRVNFNELTAWPITMEIVKQRNGPTGPVRFTFLRECLRYEDAYLNTGGEERAQRKAEAQKDIFDDE